MERRGPGAASLGLRRGTVRLAPWSPSWAEAFTVEQDLLEQCLGDRVGAIEHIGSTAVPGLAAKPVVDLQVGLDSLEALDEVLPALVELGYEVMLERRYPDRCFLPKGPRERRTHHLNLVRRDSDAWRHPLAFRDRLRADESLRLAYEDLKRRLAAEHPDDREAYTRGKAGFVGRVVAGH